MGCTSVLCSAQRDGPDRFEGRKEAAQQEGEAEVRSCTRRSTLSTVITQLQTLARVHVMRHCQRSGSPLSRNPLVSRSLLSLCGADSVAALLQSALGGNTGKLTCARGESLDGEMVLAVISHFDGYRPSAVAYECD